MHIVHPEMGTFLVFGAMVLLALFEGSWITYCVMRRSPKRYSEAELELAKVEAAKTVREATIAELRQEIRVELLANMKLSIAENAFRNGEESGLKKGRKQGRREGFIEGFLKTSEAFAKQLGKQPMAAVFPPPPTPPTFFPVGSNTQLAPSMTEHRHPSPLSHHPA